MKNVIEEQFRLIESGRPPSGPHQVPRVAIPSIVTGSETFDVPVDIPLDVVDDEDGAGGGGRAVGPEAVTNRPQKRVESRPAFSPRSRAVMIAAGVVAAVAVAIIVVQIRKGSRPVAVPVAEVPVPSLETHPEVKSGISPTSLPPEHVPAPDEPPVTPAHRADARGRPATVSTPTRNAARPTATQEPAATPAPTATAPATEPAPLPLHIQPGKPKVQLERDNPWP